MPDLVVCMEFKGEVRLPDGGDSLDILPVLEIDCVEYVLLDLAAYQKFFQRYIEDI